MRDHQLHLQCDTDEWSGDRIGRIYSTADNTTDSSSDYNAVSGTVNFAANDTSEPITVQVNGDTQVEIDEVFTVNLANASGCVLLDPNGFGTIQNDDSGVPVSECGDPGTNRFSIGDASVIEGDTGAPRKLRIAVTVTNPAASQISGRLHHQRWFGHGARGLQSPRSG